MTYGENGGKYLWDTNTVIYYLQKQLNDPASIFLDLILTDNRPAISAITEIELLCWKGSELSQSHMMKSFIYDAKVFELGQLIKEQAIRIRKKYAVKLPDAIIAATALTYNLTLISRNVADFKKIAGLKVENPFSGGVTCVFFKGVK